jgi:NADPH2:quinone reductase
MRAIFSSLEGPVLQEVPRPSPGEGEVLVRVRANALNRADLMMLRGGLHGGFGGVGFPLGLEFAGEIVEVGPGVEGRQVGDRVMCAGLAEFAEYAIAHPRRMYTVPAGMSLEQAATLPVALQTMHDAIGTNGMLAAGQSVLVQGASSAMGLMGMQVAKVLGAGTVIGTSTSPERRARLPEFGADVVLDSGAADWSAQVLDATRGEGVDLLIDLLAGPLVNGGLRATRIGGRMVNVGRMAGEQGEFDFDLNSLRRITYVGVTFRTRRPEEVEEIVARATRALGPAMDAGTLRMPIDEVFRFGDAAEAFERMGRNQHFGKIVLVDPSASAR